MWLILQHAKPDDFVLATGETHPACELIELAFAKAGIGIQGQGKARSELGACAKAGRVLVKIDSRHVLPPEVDLLSGEPSKARAKLA